MGGRDSRTRRWAEQAKREGDTLTVSDISDLSSEAANVTDAEFQQIQNIGATTIAAAAWSALSSLTSAMITWLTSAIATVAIATNLVSKAANEVITGSWKFGDATNNTQFESDGTIKFNGTATVWDDIRIVPGSFDRPGVSDPAINTYAVGGGGTNSYLYEFAKNDIVSFTVQLPHSYDEGEDIYVHAHWTPGARGAAENGNYVGWKVDYSWANVDGAFGAMATADLSDVCDGTDHKHQMTPDVAITGTSKTLSSMLVCNLKRTDTGTDDTWASAAAGSQPMILEVDFHFPQDTVGSRSMTAK